MTTLQLRSQNGALAVLFLYCTVVYIIVLPAIPVLEKFMYVVYFHLQHFAD